MTVVLSWIVIVISAVITLFQLLLAFGKPWGNLAWGGKHKKLPTSLRIGSFISAIIFILAIIVVLEKSKIFILINSDFLINVLLWIFTLIFGLSVIGNLTSKSKVEKKVMTPIAIILFISFLFLGISE